MLTALPGAPLRQYFKVFSIMRARKRYRPLRVGPTRPGGPERPIQTLCFANLAHNSSNGVIYAHTPTRGSSEAILHSLLLSCELEKGRGLWRVGPTGPGGPERPRQTLCFANLAHNASNGVIYAHSPTRGSAEAILQSFLYHVSSKKVEAC